MNHHINDLANTFSYKPDGQLDNWRIMDPDNYVGDCDDYAVTALYLECDKSLLKFWWMLITFQATFWFTKSPAGGGHLVLWVRGEGYIDNWDNRLYRPKSAFSEYKFLFPWPFPFVAMKMFFGKLTSILKK